MHRAVHNISHGNNALVQEVKVSRIDTPHKKENISHLYPEKANPAFEEHFHSEEKKHLNQKTFVKNKINLNKLLNNFKDDDFIILGVILLLVFEGTDDFILLIALGYLLLF